MALNEVTGLFCQLVLLLLFAFSAVQKLRDHLAYERSVEGFAVLPARWITPLAWLMTCVECLIVALLLGGLFWNGIGLVGMLVALILLLFFTGILISVLARGLDVPCGCFGADNHPVSATSLVRNVGLIVCSISGIFFTFTPASLVRYPVQTFCLTTLMAAAFVLLWSHLDEVALVLRPRAG